MAEEFLMRLLAAVSRSALTSISTAARSPRLIFFLVSTAAALWVLGAWIGADPGVREPSPLAQPQGLGGRLAGAGAAGAGGEGVPGEPQRRGAPGAHRAHGLRTYFGATGIRVHDRTAAESPRAAFTLAGGRRPPRTDGAGESRRDRERGVRGVEIRRPGRSGVVRKLGEGVSSRALPSRSASRERGCWCWSWRWRVRTRRGMARR